MNIFTAFPFFEFERPRTNRMSIGRIFSEVAAPVNVGGQDRSTDRVKAANQRCEWLFKRVAVLQERLVQRQEELAKAQGEIAQGLVKVYRALGGGWQIRETAPEEVVVPLPE